MTHSTPTNQSEELTTEQKVRFQILIDYYLAMEGKRQADKGTHQISDGSEISKQTWRRIEALIRQEVLDALNHLEQSQQWLQVDLAAITAEKTRYQVGEKA